MITELKKTYQSVRYILCAIRKKPHSRLVVQIQIFPITKNEELPQNIVKESTLLEILFHYFRHL